MRISCNKTGGLKKSGAEIRHNPILLLAQMQNLLKSPQLEGRLNSKAEFLTEHGTPGNFLWFIHVRKYVGDSLWKTVAVGRAAFRSWVLLRRGPDPSE